MGTALFLSKHGDGDAHSMILLMLCFCTHHFCIIVGLSTETFWSTTALLNEKFCEDFSSDERKLQDTLNEDIALFDKIDCGGTYRSFMPPLS
jgi:hypothetical protein